jgi:hypothetical protein
MSMPTLNALKTRLAAIAATVSGLRRAYAEAPASLAPGDLPIFIPFVGPVSAFGRISDQLAEETRTYNLRLYVKPVQAGYDGEAERAVEPFLTSLRDAFLAHPALGLGSASSQIPFIESMTWLGDGGIVVLPFAGENFLGAEFRLSVKAIVQITLAGYE